MVSPSTSSSLSSLYTSRSGLSVENALPSPGRSVSSSVSSASSSLSLDLDDEENVTITGNRLSPDKKGKRKSQEDLRILAVSTSITELSYSISDIQTRIFEIQELRHKSQPGDSSSTSRVIDQSLASLDERLDAVSQGVENVNRTLQPLIQASQKTPTIPFAGEAGANPLTQEDEITLRKHAVMLSEWEAVQKESQILREELKEDKWLTVFRTVTDQADGMMSSLEKAINRCQDFLFRMQKSNHDESITPSSSMNSMGLNGDKEKPLTVEVFTNILESYEAKKKHYMPATTKVLSIIDKGVQDRVTKNGECLRRHAESTTRWKNLKDRIARTDAQMAEMKERFLSQEHEVLGSEAGSSTSGVTHRSGKGKYLEASSSGGSTSKSKSKSSHSGSPISRSISPFKKLARKIKGGGSKSPVPQTPPLPKMDGRTPSSEPVPKLRHRSSLFNINMLTASASKVSAGSSSLTPDRENMGHKHSHSLTPESTPSKMARNANELSTSLAAIASVSATGTMKSTRPAWNSSTRIEPDERARMSKPRRPSVTSSSSPFHQPSEDGSISHATVPSTPSYKRSVSRTSMASSRPWSPVTSSVSASTAQSSLSQSMSGLYRSPSRQAQSLGLGVSPRTRPKTPSHIPAPSKSHWRSMSASPSPGKGWDDDEEFTSSLMQRAFSPTSASFAPRSHTPSGHPPRPPSRSMIPVPSVQVSGASRPGTSMSSYGRPESSMSFRGTATTPKPSTHHPSLSQGAKLPPSSFKDSISGASRTSLSRPPSRSGATTASSNPTLSGQGPLHIYIPLSSKDPLDTALATIVNSLSHSLLIERLDPPLKRPPGEGEEVKAQYAFTLSAEGGGVVGRKIVWCKLTTLGRGGGDKRKVMCRVGGGWQDLQVYIASRQAQAGL